MFVKKQFIAFIGALVLIFSTAFCVSKTQVINTNSSSIDTVQKIILDAGHGGFDGGAVASDGTVEKNINLAITLKIADMLRFAGFDVILTRDADTGTEDDEGQPIASRKKSDLHNRLTLMQENEDAIFISIHLNKFTTSAAFGAQVFYSPKFDEARQLGVCVQKSVVGLLQPENNRVVKQGNKNTFLLKNAPIPSVIVECGFLSNSQELERLKTEEYQSQMAFAVTDGIISFLNKN